MPVENENTDSTPVSATETPALPASELQPETSPVEKDEPLGESGLKALQSERDRRKTLERENASMRAQLSEIEASKLSDLEKAQRAADEAEKRAISAENMLRKRELELEHNVRASLIPDGEQEQQLAFIQELLDWHNSLISTPERVETDATENKPVAPVEPIPTQGETGAVSSGLYEYIMNARKA